MNDFAAALSKAFALIGGLDAELLKIVLLSLSVSLSGSLCASLIGAPLGTALAVYRFRGRNALIVIANALLGLPPVVVGLVIYLPLSRSGPLGSFGILFTPETLEEQVANKTPTVDLSRNRRSGLSVEVIGGKRVTVQRQRDPFFTSTR